MKKYYIHIIVNLIGVIIGIIIGVKWLGDKTVYNGDLRIRQKGRGNTQQPTVNLEIAPKQRKLDRIQARAERIKQRQLDKLNK